MKKIIRYMITAAAAVSLQACSFLDLAPQDSFVSKTFYKDKTQVEEALMGVYSTLASSNLYGGCILGRMGLSADIGYEDYSSDEGTVGYNSVVPQDTKVTNYWKQLYNGIGMANKLLENIDAAEGLDEELLLQYKSEARFLRAYFYFMLTKRFGAVPLVTESPRTVAVDQLQIARTPQKEVYEFILSEMEAAAPGVVKTQTLVTAGGGRVSRSAVYGIMARVCLNMAGEPLLDTDKYARARACADSVISTGFHKLNPDFTQVFKNYMQKKYDVRESIWEVEFYGNNVGSYTNTAGQVGRNNGIKMGATYPGADSVGVSIGTVRANPYYYSIFEDADLRRDWTIADYVYKTTGKTTPDANKWDRFSGKFRREYETLTPKSQTYTATNLPLLRYSDVLLMYAEAVACDPAQGGDLAKAWECVNMVRRRGYGKPAATPDPTVDIPATGREDLFELIIDERARELGHEFLRKDDLTRWGIYLSRMQYLKSLIDLMPTTYTSSYYASARSFYGDVTSRDVLWPIPSYDISVNRELTQNPGW